MTFEELAARECIRDTLARYNHAGDRGRLSELAACFVPNGVLELRHDDLARGPREIEVRLSRVVSDSRERTERPLVRHHVSNIGIQFEGLQEARVHCYFVVFTETGLDHWGRYADRFCPLGEQWLIAYRRVHIDGASPGSRMAVDFLAGRA